MGQAVQACALKAAAVIAVGLLDEASLGELAKPLVDPGSGAAEIVCDHALADAAEPLPVGMQGQDGQNTDVILADVGVT